MIVSDVQFTLKWLSGDNRYSCIASWVDCIWHLSLTRRYILDTIEGLTNLDFVWSTFDGCSH